MAFAAFAAAAPSFIQGLASTFSASPTQKIAAEALPRNAAGKILKRELRDALVERDG